MTVFQSDQVSSQLAPEPSAVPAKWLGVAVAFVAILAFSPILANHFITLDDGNLVSKNPDFNPPQPSHWGHYWTGPTQEAYKPHELYMPMTYMLWGVTSMIAQTADEAGKTTLNPTVFHGLSLLLHAINAVLVFLILRKLRAGDWSAFFGAILFAVHPLQTESVAWVAETSILLSGVFSLWAILEFLQFSDLRGVGGSPPMSFSPNTGGPPVPRDIARARIHYALGTLALALALLSKAPAVVVPALVLIIEVLLRRRNWRTLVGPLALWGAMCVPIVILTHHWQVSFFTVPWIQRPIVAADALAFYLYSTFVPIGLLPNYGRTPAWLMAHPTLAASTWLAPAALLTLCIALWRKARWFAVASMLFAVALLPVLGFNVFVYQRFSTTADRFVYLAMLGPALALACAIALRPRTATFAVAGVLLAILVGLSIRQSTYWSDSLALFTRVIDAHPDSQKGQEQVAVAYDARMQKEIAAKDGGAARSSIRQAREHFLIAAKLPEDDGMSYYNAANCCFILQEWSEAISYFESALRDLKFELRPAAYNQMGVCYQSLATKCDRLGNLYQSLAAAYGQMGIRYQSSAAAFDQMGISYRSFGEKDIEAASQAYRNAIQASESPAFAEDRKAAAEHLRRMQLDKSLEEMKNDKATR